MAVAAGAVVVNGRNIVGDSRNGNLLLVWATVTFSGSYSTAGEVPTGSSWEAQLGMDRIFHAIGHVGEGGPPPTTFAPVFWNPVTAKLQVGTSNGAGPALLAEKTAAAWGTAPTGQILFVGR